VQAQVLRHAVADHLDDPATFARVYDARTQQRVTPFYRAQVAADMTRLAEMDAVAHGAPPPPPPDTPMTRLLAAAGTDPVAFRALIETVTCMAFPEQVVSRPAVRAAIERGTDRVVGPQPGPDRAGLLDLLAA
jgi:hypothetical protein